MSEPLKEINRLLHNPILPQSAQNMWAEQMSKNGSDLSHFCYSDYSRFSSNPPFTPCLNNQSIRAIERVMILTPN